MWNATEIGIDEIGDRYLRQYVALDYFHDSFINEITLSDGGRTVVMSIACEREGASRATREDPTYLYRLTFRDCSRLEMTFERPPLEYINGRFKWIDDGGRPRTSRGAARDYLLRMSVEDDAGWPTYVDIRFRRFSISRAVGTVDPAAAEALVGRARTNRSPLSDMSLSEVRRRAVSGRGWQRLLAFEELVSRRDRACVPLAERRMRSADEETVATSVHALGLLGARAHLPSLASLLKKTENGLARRQIVEAMTRIASR